MNKTLTNPTQWRPGLYAIVDPEYTHGRDLIAFAKTLIPTAAALQLRAKHTSDRDFLSLALTLKALCHEATIPFIVNDRPGITSLCNADGLHLGQNDMSIADARTIFGTACIGLSTHNLEQAQHAEKAGADLISIGPVFPTKTKGNPDPVVGLTQLERICKTVSLPTVAIGGINLSNAAATLQCGAQWIAAISSAQTLAASSAWRSTTS